MVRLVGVVDHIVVVVVGNPVVVGMPVAVGKIDPVAVGTVLERTAFGSASTSGKQVRRYLDKTAGKELESISGQQTVRNKTFVFLSVFKYDKKKKT